MLLLVAASLGCLGAAACIAIAGRMGVAELSRAFWLARKASEGIGAMLGWSAYRTAHDLTGFAVQQMAVGVLMGGLGFVVLRWLSRRARSDRELFTMTGIVASVTPWVALALVIQKHIPSAGEGLFYSLILVALGVSCYGVVVVALRGGVVSRLPIALGAGLLALWIWLTAPLPGLESATAWTSLIVSVLALGAGSSWYSVQTQETTAHGT